MVPNEHWGCAAVPPGLIAYARFVRGVVVVYVVTPHVRIMPFHMFI